MTDWTIGVAIISAKCSSSCPVSSPSLPPCEAIIALVGLGFVLSRVKAAANNLVKGFAGGGELPRGVNVPTVEGLELRGVWVKTPAS